MNTDRSHDASAYLDGASTPAERAAVEADPVTLGEVERFRALRDELRRTDEPVDTADAAVAGVQERAIVAALAAFDDLHPRRAAAAEQMPEQTPEPTVERRAGSVVPIPSRRGLPSWLGAAAAVVLVLAAGALLVSRGSGQDQDEASTEPATLAVTDDAGADGAESRSAEAATATGEAAPMVAAEDAPESADPGEDATSGGATAEGDIAPGTEAPAAIEAPETAAAAVELVGSTALAAYAEETVTAWRTAGTWPPPPDDRCVDAATAPTDAIALGEVAYAVSEAEALRPALLLTDGSTSEVRALDPSDCRVLDEAELDLAAP